MEEKEEGGGEKGARGVEKEKEEEERKGKERRRKVKTKKRAREGGRERRREREWRSEKFCGYIKEEIKGIFHLILSFLS